MIRKKYIKRAYIEECVCDKCGIVMEPCNVVLSYPPQYSYACLKCGEQCYTAERFDGVKYEFEEEKNE